MNGPFLFGNYAVVVAIVVVGCHDDGGNDQYRGMNEWNCRWHAELPTADYGTVEYIACSRRRTAYTAVRDMDVWLVVASLLRCGHCFVS